MLNQGLGTTDEFIEALEQLRMRIQSERRRILACLTKTDELNPSRNMLDNVPMLIRARFGIEAGEKIIHLLTEILPDDGHEVHLFATSAVGYTRKAGKWVPNISNDHSQIYDEKNWFPIGVEKPFFTLFEIIADKQAEKSGGGSGIYSRMVDFIFSRSPKKGRFPHREMLRLIDEQLPAGLLENQFIEDVETFFQNAGFSVEYVTLKLLTIENPNRQPWNDIGPIVVSLLENGQIKPIHLDELKTTNQQLSLSGKFSIYVHQASLIEDTIFHLWELKQAGYVVAPVHFLTLKNALISRFPDEEIGVLQNLRERWRLIRDPFEGTKGRYDPQWVIGQDELLEGIMEHIESGDRPFMIWGMRRSGKTVAMRQILYRCRARGYPVAEWTCSETTVEYIFRTIVLELANSIISLYPDITLPAIGSKDEYQYAGEDQFFYDMLALKNTISGQGYNSRMVILLDQFDLNLIVPGNKSEGGDILKRYTVFTQALLKVLEHSELNSRVILGVAAEYGWATLTQSFDGQTPNAFFERFKFNDTVKVFPMKEVNAEELIVRNGALGGLAFTSESLEAILRESECHPEIALSLGSCIWQTRLST